MSCETKTQLRCTNECEQMNVVYDLLRDAPVEFICDLLTVCRMRCTVEGDHYCLLAYQCKETMRRRKLKEKS